MFVCLLSSAAAHSAIFHLCHSVVEVKAWSAKFRTFTKGGEWGGGTFFSIISTGSSAYIIMMGVDVQPEQASTLPEWVVITATERVFIPGDWAGVAGYGGGEGESEAA